MTDYSLWCNLKDKNISLMYGPEICISIPLHTGQGAVSVVLISFKQHKALVRVCQNLNIIVYLTYALKLNYSDIYLNNLENINQSIRHLRIFIPSFMIFCSDPY